jgi:hypothetical protein
MQRRAALPDYTKVDAGNVRHGGTVRQDRASVPRFQQKPCPDPIREKQVVNSLGGSRRTRLITCQTVP